MDQDRKHQCKFCSKSFTCSRSLGGHMRSHVTLAATANANGVLVEKTMKIEASRGYELRENPKKSWRLSKSFDLGKNCGECGKEFQSWKALFGHMRCHSNKVSKDVEEEDENGGVEGSWLGGGRHCLLEVKVPRKKMRSRRSASVSVSSSSASESYYSKEQEDVAISLMMLSRDAGFGFSHFAGSSDKNSVAFDGIGNLRNKELELKDVSDVDCDAKIKKSMADYASDSDYLEVTENFDDCIKKKKIGFDWINSEVKKNSIVIASKLEGDLEKKRRKYECVACNKSFNTHQALGGHKASHKRLKGACFAENNNLEVEAGALIEQVAGNEIVEKMKGKHQCLICSKVFASGQALGGHKRSHFVVASPRVDEVIQQDLIDHNLPQVEQDSSKGSVSVVDAEYNFWWDASNLQH